MKNHYLKQIQAAKTQAEIYELWQYRGAGWFYPRERIAMEKRLEELSR